MISATKLAEGARRLPYFFIHGAKAVLCPDCAKSAPEPEKLTAVYTASRLYACGGCRVFIGPADDEERRLG